jgi:hypothetical protein
MANVNAPLGFQMRGKLGSKHSGAVIRMSVPASDGTALYLGDAVKSNGTTDQTFGCMQVTAAGASDVIVGVVVGVNPILGVAIGSENLNRVYRPASTYMVLDVEVDPEMIYEIQTSGTLASSDIGKYANLTASTAGSAITGMSGMQLNESSVTATKAGAQMVIVDLIHSPDNAIDAANTRVLVKLVNTLFAQ